METLMQDVRYGLRVLLKRPGFALVAVVTLALGIGANTAIFSVVNGVLLRPLPYEDPERIVTLWQNNIKSGIERDDVAPANSIDWREQNRVFEELAVAEPFSHRLSSLGEPEVFRSWLVSEGFFDVLGVKALYGRTFTAEEYQPGNEFAIIIGYSLWQRRFGSDPDIVGQKLMLNGRNYTVLGVMPPEFHFPPESGREAWAPRIFSEPDKRRRGSGYLKAIARLKPGVSIEQARDEMLALASHLAEQYPQTNREVGATLVALPEQLVGHVRPALLVLLGAVGLVLLIACANVANLMLVRGAERQREFAIRSALGAARVRLVRQLFTESFCLALIGGVGGVLLASWGIDLILALSPGNLPRVDQVVLDGRVLGFALVVSTLTALAFGLIPSIEFSNPNLQESLKEGGRTVTGGSAHHRLRNLLVVSEVALALVLLVGAGLLVRSFVSLLQIEPGFSRENIATLEVHVWGKYRTPQQQAAFFDQTIEQISTLPGVEAAAAVSALPFHDNSIDVDASFIIEGHPAPLEGHEPSAYHTIITPDYFRALGVPLVRGRFFSQFDKDGAPLVALINETLARRYWPDEDPVGRKIRVGFGRQPAATREIVGVVGDVRHAGLHSNPRPELFLPHPQTPYGSMTFVVRTGPDPVSLIPALKQRVWAVDKDQAFSSVSTMEALVSRSLGERRFNLVLFSTFALLALGLAGVGIYGLISFSTSQRTHEIGIRLALGAGSGDIVKMVLKEGIVLSVAGVLIGLLGAFGMTQLLKSMLFGVTPQDPITFGGISALLIAVALLASYIPARRAARVDPMVALRDQ